MNETRKLHPLHSPDFINQFVRANGVYFPIHRGTGRTTAHCLRVLATAIENPDVWVCFTDHHGTTPATCYMLEQVQRMGEALRLEHMTHAYGAGQAMVCFSRRPPDRNLMRNRMVQK